VTGVLRVVLAVLGVGMEWAVTSGLLNVRGKSQDYVPKHYSILLVPRSLKGTFLSYFFLRDQVKFFLLPEEVGPFDISLGISPNAL